MVESLFKRQNGKWRILESRRTQNHPARFYSVHPEAYGFTAVALILIISWFGFKYLSYPSYPPTAYYNYGWPPFSLDPGNFIPYYVATLFLSFAIPTVLLFVLSLKTRSAVEALSFRSWSRDFRMGSATSVIALAVPYFYAMTLVTPFVIAYL